MANTFIGTKEAGGLHFHFFSTTNAATTETCAAPAGKQFVVGLQANIGGTATALTFKYTTASGNADFSALTGTQSYIFCVITD